MNFKFGENEYKDFSREVYIIINATTNIVCCETEDIEYVKGYLNIIQPQYPTNQYMVIKKFENISYEDTDLYKEV